MREKETVVGLDLMLVLSTARLCSLNLSFRRRSQVAQFCGQNCSTCPYITNGLTSYTFYATGETRSITSHITFNTKNVIYMVQCNRCNLQCIGETKRRLKDRFNDHRRAVDKTNINLNPLLFVNTFSLTLTILILTCS